MNRGLEKVVFIPSSLGVQVKERISVNGDRKAGSNTQIIGCQPTGAQVQ